MLYVNNNGEVIHSEGYTIRSGNRAYLYGDGLFETIRIIDGRPINVEHHVARMLEGAKMIKMRLPGYLSEGFFTERIMEVLEKSGIDKGGRCRVSLDRMTGGTYLPESNEVEYFIEVYPLSQNSFVLNARGLEVDVYSEHRKSKEKLSNFKLKNGLIYVLAAISAQEKGLDDYLITNKSGGILEGTSSNLFMVSNGVLYTPSLEEGCLAGTMRMQIINLAIRNEMKVYECNVTPSNLLAADEIFLTNAIDGIQWVSGYRTKRYFNNVSKQLVELLNAFWMG